MKKNFKLWKNWIRARPGLTWNREKKKMQFITGGNSLRLLLVVFSLLSAAVIADSMKMDYSFIGGRSCGGQEEIITVAQFESAVSSGPGCRLIKAINVAGNVIPRQDLNSISATTTTTAIIIAPTTTPTTSSTTTAATTTTTATTATTTLATTVPGNCLGIKQNFIFVRIDSFLTYF